MENVIAERVKHAALTKAQLKIADYFARYPEKVGISSSMEVAKEIGVSDASITRFARAIGYDGFTDLKNDIYNSLAMQATGGIGTLSLTERFSVNRAGFGTLHVKTDYIKNTQYMLERAFQQNSDEAFECIISALMNANHRYIVGFRGCRGVADRFAYLLRVIADHVLSISDEGPGGISMIQDIGQDDCVVIFSVSRYYKQDDRIVRIAKARGAKVCVITDGIVSPLTKNADVVLLAETKSMSYFQSTTSVNIIAEYVLMQLAERCQENYNNRAAERDEMTEELRL